MYIDSNSRQRSEELSLVTLSAGLEPGVPVTTTTVETPRRNTVKFGASQWTPAQDGTTVTSGHAVS